jgi:hypothetical protein
MNDFDEEKTQSILRRAPRPKAPEGLKERLIMEARSRSQKSPEQRFVMPSRGFRRWWPALIPAGLSLICVVVLAVQQQEIRELQKSIHSLNESLANDISHAPVKLETNPGESMLAERNREIVQLKETAQQLESEIAALEKLRVENQTIRTQLSAPPPGLSVEEVQWLTDAREGAEKIACVNNMKQMGLAAHIWAGDNENRFPQDVISMSNELTTAKILICPADKGRQAAPDFGSFTMANCSYEWFLNPPSSGSDPERVLTRCPIHGSVGLCDGSVQMGVAKDHPERLVQRDGKLYYHYREATVPGGGN